MEMKLRAKQVEGLQHSLGFARVYVVERKGLSEGIGLFWSNDVSVELKNYSSGHIDVMVQKVVHSSPT